MGGELLRYGDRVTSIDSTLLAGFVDECRAAATGDDAVVRIVAILEQLIVDRDGLAEATGPLPDDIPAMGIDETLFEDEHVTVMVIATPPDIAQPPHDHRMTAVIGVFDGQEDQRFFVNAPSGLRELTGRSIATGEVMSLGRKTIHAISATGPQACRAVHVYLGPLATVERSIFHPDTLVEEPFSVEAYEAYCRPLNNTVRLRSVGLPEARA